MALYKTKSPSNGEKYFYNLKEAYEEFEKDDKVWCIETGKNNYWMKAIKGDRDESILAVINYRNNKRYRNAENGEIFWSNETFYSDSELKEEKEYKEIFSHIKKYALLCKKTPQTDDKFKDYQKVLEFYQTKFMTYVNKKTKQRRKFISIKTNEEFKNFCKDN